MSRGNRLRLSSIVCLISVCVAVIFYAYATSGMSYSIVYPAGDARSTFIGTQGGAVLHENIQILGNLQVGSFVNGRHFVEVDVPQGATIRSATLQLFSAKYAVGSTFSLRIRGEDIDHADLFTHDKGPETRELTQTYVTQRLHPWLWKEAPGFWVEPMDVTAIVQELVDRVGRDQGNSLALIGENAQGSANSFVVVYTADKSLQRAAQLHIDWHEKIIPEQLGLDNQKDEMQGNIQDRGVAPESSFLPPIGEGITPHIMGRVFPGEPACDAQLEYADGRTIHTLKPEYFTVGYDGNLVLLNEKIYGCNGFSEKNVEHIKRYSQQQFVTVSADGEAMKALVVHEEKRNRAIEELIAFVKKYELTGVEIDFEDFAAWSEGLYASYLIFLDELGTQLHASGFQLMVDVPPIGNKVEQALYHLRYEDFRDLPIDYLVIMAYDYQYDHGNGTPLAPLDWLEDIVRRAQERIPASQLVLGIPSYAYYGEVGKFLATLTTYDEVMGRLSGVSPSRDTASQEMYAQIGNNIFFYVDQAALDSKLHHLTSLGVEKFSVWHVGGNKRFSEY